LRPAIDRGIEPAFFVSHARIVRVGTLVQKNTNVPLLAIDFDDDAAAHLRQRGRFAKKKTALPNLGDFEPAPVF
jgi:hypothetical protein